MAVINPPRAPDSHPQPMAEPAEMILDNGLRIFLVERPGSSIAEMRLVLRDGFAGEPRERSGLAGLAMAMLSEGALRVGGARLDVLQESLCATFGGRVMVDGALVEVSALAANFPDPLALCGRVLSNLQFDRDDFERVRANRIALIGRERQNPAELALRFLPAKLYGEGHPYACPFTGSGTEIGVAALTADDVREYYEKNLTPERMAAVIAGPLTIRDAKPLLEEAFGHWRVSTTIAPISQRAGDEIKSNSGRLPVLEPAVTLVERPGMEQAALVMGLPTVARESGAAESLIVADAIIAGMFSSRLNLKLREERGWTYGVRSSLIDARFRGLWLISSFVRLDRAVDAIVEIDSELGNLAGKNSCSSAELGRAVDYLVARTPATRETCAQTADMLAADLVLRLPPGYRRDVDMRLRKIGGDTVGKVCRDICQRSMPHWLVVGSPALPRGGLRESGFANMELLDRSALP